jgi:hypothetical protein
MKVFGRRQTWPERDNFPIFAWRRNTTKGLSQDNHVQTEI